MYYHLTDLAFWAYGILAVIAFFLSFYIPGKFFLQRILLPSKIITTGLSTALGMVLWGAQGVLFGYLQIRWASYLYLLIFSIIFLLQRKTQLSFLRSLVDEITKSSKIVVIAVLLGICIQILPVANSGLKYAKGVEFFYTNAVDGIMHLAYIQSMARVFPPQEPSAAGLQLANYHYWSDLIQADLVRVWHLPVSHLFFQYMPLLTAILISVFTYSLIRVWGFSKKAGLWTLFFTYFGGDMTYFFTLLIQHRLNFETPVIDNGVTQFLNMPHVFARVIFLAGLLPFTFWIKTKQRHWLFFALILFSSLIGLKVYFGMFVTISLGSVFALQFFIAAVKVKNIKKIFLAQWKNWVLFLLFLTLSAAIFLPTNKTAGGLFYSPLEWPKIFLGRDGIDWLQWWQRRDVYAQFNNQRGMLFLDVVAIGICLLSVYGTRLVGFVVSPQTRKHVGYELLVFFGASICIFTFLGLFTLQTSGLFNVFNFFAVSATGLALFSGIFAAELWSKKTIFAKICIIVLFCLTIPRSVQELSFFLQRTITNKYNNIFLNSELETLVFIQKNTHPTEIIQASLYNENDRQAPYVSLFANRDTYLSGDGLLESHNQPYLERKAKLKEIFDAESSQEMAERAKSVGITVLYLVKRSNQSEKLRFSPSAADFDTLFENNYTTVLRIKK